MVEQLRAKIGLNISKQKRSDREKLGLEPALQQFKFSTPSQKLTFMMYGVSIAMTIKPAAAERSSKYPQFSTSDHGAKTNQVLRELDEPATNRTGASQPDHYGLGFLVSTTAPSSVGPHLGVNPYIPGDRKSPTTAPLLPANLSGGHNPPSYGVPGSSTGSRSPRAAAQSSQLPKDRDIFSEHRRWNPASFRNFLKQIKLDESTGVPAGVAGRFYSIKELANSPLMTTRARTLDEPGRLALIQASFDQHRIDTAFPFGSSFHAMATILQRTTGNKYNSSEAIKVLMDFNALVEQSPSDDPRLQAAQIMEVEKDWPEIENADPEQVRNERIASVVDNVIVQLTGPAIHFNETEVILFKLKGMIGLDEEQLTKELPVTPVRPGGEKAISILDLFKRHSQFKSYPVVYNIYPDRIKVEYTGDGSVKAPVLRVHFSDGAKADITPSEIIEKEILKHREKLRFDLWVNLKAQTVARGKARQGGNLPPDDVAKEIKAVIEHLGPPTPREMIRKDIREKVPAIPMVGDIANIPLLGYDLMEGDYTTFWNKLPLSSDLLSRSDIASDVINRNLKGALSKTLQLLPKNVGSLYTWMTKPKEWTGPAPAGNGHGIGDLDGAIEQLGKSGNTASSVATNLTTASTAAAQTDLISTSASSRATRSRQNSHPHWLFDPLRGRGSNAPRG